MLENHIYPFMLEGCFFFFFFLRFDSAGAAPLDSGSPSSPTALRFLSSAAPDEAAGVPTVPASVIGPVAASPCGGALKKHETKKPCTGQGSERTDRTGSRGEGRSRLSCRSLVRSR